MGSGGRRLFQEFHRKDGKYQQPPLVKVLKRRAADPEKTNGIPRKQRKVAAAKKASKAVATKKMKAVVEAEGEDGEDDEEGEWEAEDIIMKAK